MRFGTKTIRFDTDASADYDLIQDAGFKAQIRIMMGWTESQFDAAVLEGIPDMFFEILLDATDITLTIGINGETVEYFSSGIAYTNNGYPDFTRYNTIKIKKVSITGTMTFGVE